jgi:hypothetical protein
MKRDGLLPYTDEDGNRAYVVASRVMHMRRVGDYTDITIEGDVLSARDAIEALADRLESILGDRTEGV